MELGWVALPGCGSAPGPASGSISGPLPSLEDGAGAEGSRLLLPAPSRAHQESAVSPGALCQVRGTEASESLSHCFIQQIILLRKDPLCRLKDVILLTYMVFDILACFFCVCISGEKERPSAPKCGTQGSAAPG